ncbi:dipeptidase PepV [Pontibacillus salicampi]|uniref:Dipeptidase PepV n=1 Tax=Pontibacillus salicampi TaxID=1449801 RepID=A0ABV6LIQ8_9BACI
MRPEFIVDTMQTEESYLVEKTMELLRIPSVYEEVTIKEGQPFGEPIQQALSWMLQLGEKEGFTVKNVDGYAGHVEWGHGEEIIGILGHLDVVPPGEGWSGSPFQPRLEEGKLIARGAQDDKGPVMAAFLALRWLKDQGVQPTKRIRLIVGTDEERNWECMKHYEQVEEMPSFGFSPDASFPVIHAEKGLYDVELTKQLSFQEQEEVHLISMAGGERLNMVPEKATATIQWKSDAPASLFKSFINEKGWEGTISRRGSLWDIEITGKTAHAMEPANGVNAIIGLMDFLKQLPFSHPVQNTFNWVSIMLGSTRGEPLHIQQADTVSGPLTINVGVVQYREGEITFGLNIRYPVTSDLENWYDAFSSYVSEQGFSIHQVEHLLPIYLPKNHPRVQQLLSVYHKHTGDTSQPIAIGGATYARSLKEGVAFGAMFPDSPDTAHQPDEYVYVRDLMRAAIIYAEVLYELVTE